MSSNNNALSLCRVAALALVTLLLNACVAYDPLLGGSAKPTATGSSSTRAPASTRPPTDVPPASDLPPTVPPVTSAPSKPATTKSVPRPTGPAAFLLDEAQAHQRSGDLPAAAASIERAMRIEPNSPWLSLALADVRLAQGNARQAEALAQRARVQSGGDRVLKNKSWLVTAEARRQRGDAAGADDAMRQAGQ